MQFGLPPLAGALVVNLGLIDIVCMYSRDETILVRYGRHRWGGPSVATTCRGSVAQGLVGPRVSVLVFLSPQRRPQREQPAVTVIDHGAPIRWPARRARGGSGSRAAV